MSAVFAQVCYLCFSRMGIRGGYECVPTDSVCLAFVADRTFLDSTEIYSYCYQYGEYQHRP